MKSEILLRVIEERIEELKADIKEFTIMELEAKSEKEKITYGVKLAQTQDLLMVTIEGLEQVKKRKKIHDEIKRDIDDLMKRPFDSIDFEEVQDILIRMFKDAK